MRANLLPGRLFGPFGLFGLSGLLGILGLFGILAGGPRPARAEPVLPTLDAANTRYSALDRITADNVGRLQVAWTFSTGALRGHEGAPLVVDGVMYVHTPFPNTVTALDLDH